MVFGPKEDLEDKIPLAGSAESGLLDVLQKDLFFLSKFFLFLGDMRIDEPILANFFSFRLVYAFPYLLDIGSFCHLHLCQLERMETER